MDESSVKLSKEPGKVPTANDLIGFRFGWNARDMVFYGLAVDGAGAFSVVPIGGTSGSGATHNRAHQINSALDHPAVAEADRNKVVATDPLTGAIVFIPKNSLGNTLSIINVNSSSNIETGKIILADASAGQIELTISVVSTSDTLIAKKIDLTENPVFVTSADLIDGSNIAELSTEGESITLKWTGLTFVIV